MPSALPSDAILQDAIPTLTSPEEYVRTILQSMYDCRRDCGEPEVRLGITGEGRAPYYRVDYSEPLSGEKKLFGSFAGSKAGKGIITHEDTWSSRAMTLGEVAGVLGTIRTKDR